MDVLELTTGKIIAIKPNRFNPLLHGEIQVVDTVTVEVPVEPISENKPVLLEEMKMHELRSLAKEKGLTVDPSMKKVEIIELLKPLCTTS